MLIKKEERSILLLLLAAAAGLFIFMGLTKGWRVNLIPLHYIGYALIAAIPVLAIWLFFFWPDDSGKPPEEPR